MEADAQIPQFSLSVVDVYPEQLDFDALYEELCVEAKDATVNEETGEVTMEVIGISFDKEAAAKAYEELSWGEAIQIPLVLTEPEVKMADLATYLFQDLVGACTTNIGGTNNRLSNVTLAASCCNEVIR